MGCVFHTSRFPEQNRGSLQKRARGPRRYEDLKFEGLKIFGHFHHNKKYLSEGKDFFLEMSSLPNQEALNKALNIYRAAMREFIIFNLKQIDDVKNSDDIEDVIIESLSKERADNIDRKLYESDLNIEDIIDVNDFPHLIHKNWDQAFHRPLRDDKTFRNQLWLIVECRNASVAHPPGRDIEAESTRAHLFLIAVILSKINKQEAKSAVEAIRDELFAVNSAEKLQELERRLASAETKRSEFEKVLAEKEKRLETAEKTEKQLRKEVAEKEGKLGKKGEELNKSASQVLRLKADEKKYKQRLHKKSDELKAAKGEQRKSESRATKLAKQLTDAAEARDAFEEKVEKVSQELEEAHKKRRTYEQDFTDAKARLEQVTIEHTATMEQIANVEKLVKIVTIANLFPPLETASVVRLLDRRGIHKQNYLLHLLDLKQPTIIYVQSEEMVTKLLTDVVPEKASVIGTCDPCRPEAEETEMLERLENGKLIAAVSHKPVSRLRASHRVEHFVFCHLVPGTELFFQQCEPAFKAEKNTYLHLIYDAQQDMKRVKQQYPERYPDREELITLYSELKHLEETGGAVIKTETLCDHLNIDEPDIEIPIAIFEELQLLKREGARIQLLERSKGKKDLEESPIYCRGRIKSRATEFHAFQSENTIEQIWGKILGTLNVDDQLVLRENENHADFSTLLRQVSDDSHLYKTATKFMKKLTGRDG